MSQSTATARVPARPITRPVARERPAQPRLRVVAPVTHRPATGLALLCVALLGGGLLALLMLNISIGKGAYTLTELESQQHRLSETQQALSEQVEAQSAPQTLAAAARKLGMVPAPNPVFVTLPDGTVKGTPAVAVAPPKPAPKPSASVQPAGGTAGKAGTTTAKPGTAGKTGTTTAKTGTTTAKAGTTTAKTGTTAGKAGTMTTKTGTAKTGTTKTGTTGKTGTAPGTKPRTPAKQAESNR